MSKFVQTFWRSLYSCKDLLLDKRKKQIMGFFFLSQKWKFKVKSILPARLKLKMEIFKHLPILKFRGKSNTNSPHKRYTNVQVCHDLENACSLAGFQTFTTTTTSDLFRPLV